VRLLSKKPAWAKRGVKAVLDIPEPAGTALILGARMQQVALRLSSAPVFTTLTWVIPTLNEALALCDKSIDRRMSRLSVKLKA
jgi:hypothetical protein